MALARLAFKNLHQRVLSSPSFVGHGAFERAAIIGGAQKFSTSTDKVASEASEGKQVSATESKKSRSVLPRKHRKRGLWRRNQGDFPPALFVFHWKKLLGYIVFVTKSFLVAEFFPSGLGNALLQATENVNRLFESLNLSPWSLSGRVKEHDQLYKLKFDVPGLAKEDLKITIDDGVLIIKGEHKEEENAQSGSDDEFWSSSRRYGYYNASLVLPDDAKADDVKAELKDGVLCITIPKTEKPKTDAKEVQIH
ncbi:26.5 kDa heat shock protein, mitochondrial isoform X1 [Humulus lupulus]|uniref:26.5 kDa heat shock protein, mitochondrial isoform X1 n=1 Tax=Humulus lupulus TaxID=3486 RepID=UPI002B412CB6|nr:26.5 kDa heat shock protein, mitochondrial isoform X1 [Humulus lupulus]